jgi:hypothetical protein
MAWFAIEHLEADGQWHFKRGATSRSIRTLLDMLTAPDKGPYRGCEDNFWWRVKPSSEEEVKTIESYLKGETL